MQILCPKIMRERAADSPSVRVRSSIEVWIVFLSVIYEKSVHQTGEEATDPNEGPSAACFSRMHVCRRQRATNHDPLPRAPHVRAPPTRASDSRTRICVQGRSQVRVRDILLRSTPVTRTSQQSTTGLVV